MSDFEKRIELVIQIKCISDEQDIATLRQKEIITKDWRIDNPFNEDVLANRIGYILLNLRDKLDDDFKEYMSMNESDTKYWEEKKDCVILKLRKEVSDLKNKLHTMYISFYDLEINCKRSKDIAKDIFNGRL